MQHRSSILHTFVLAAGLAFCIFSTSAIYAETIKYQKDSTAVSLNVIPMNIQGTRYIPLESVCQQLGAECETIASQMRMNVAGNSAILVFGETEIHSSLGSFILGNAILREGGKTYVARNDLDTLMTKGFGLSAGESDASELEPLNPDEMTTEDEESEEGEATEEEETEEEMEEDAEEEPQPEENLPPPSLKDVGKLSTSVIILDAGHGGKDSGYTASTGLTEKEVTLKLANKVAALFKENTKSRVYLTREDDRMLGNRQRVKTANESSGTIFVSIHGGASLSPKANGIDIYITDSPIAGKSRVLGASPKSDATRSVELSRYLAQAVAETIVRETDTIVRSNRQAPIRVLSEIAMPGILIEVGYLSNPAESLLLSEEAYLDKIAKGIYDGIIKAAAEEKNES